MGRTRRRFRILVDGCLALGVALTGSSGCSEEATLAPPPIDDGTTDAPYIPGTAVAGQVYARIRPLEGILELLPITPPNAVPAGEHVRGVEYDPTGVAGVALCSPAGDCLPPAGMIALWTDPTKATYHSYAGTCTSNGAPINCNTLTPPCSNPGTFCAPIQMVSNVTFGQAAGAIPDVILQLAQSNNLANRIVGCQEDDAYTLGVCATAGMNCDKVDSPFSNLISPISGDSTTSPPTYPCSFCYANHVQAADVGLTGLDTALVNGLDPTLKPVFTNVLALSLQNDQPHGMTITVRYGVPTFAAPAKQLRLDDVGVAAACATPGTTGITIEGGAFGPPAPCLAASPPTDCPLSCSTTTCSQVAAAGYSIMFRNTSTMADTAGTPTFWSDTEVRATVPASLPRGQTFLGVVETPTGSQSTNVTFTTCP
jgi:hypothetical protein